MPRIERTVDEIKDRYYSVARSILVHRGSEGHPIVTRPFNYEAEVRRKKDLEKYMMRSRQQQEKGKQILQEIKKIDLKIKKLEKEEKNIARLMNNELDDYKTPELGQGQKK